MKARVQGLVDRNVEGYARKALEVALDLMDGKSVPERALVDVRFYPNPPPFIAPQRGGTAEKAEGPVPEHREPFPPAVSASAP